MNIRFIERTAGRKHRLFRVGQVEDLPDPEAREYVQAGRAVALVPDPEASEPAAATDNPTPEEGGTPAGGSGQEDDSDANTGGEGPNAPPQPPAGEGEKDPLVCPHGCRDAKPFGSAAGLASHRKQVHDE